MEPKQEIEVTSRDGSIASGHLVLVERAHPERVQAAIKSFCIFAALDIAAVFIPILHFILVPLLTFGAFFMAYNAYSDAQEIESGELVCAQCKTVQRVEPRREVYPLIYECEKCGNRMTAYKPSTSLEE